MGSDPRSLCGLSRWGMLAAVLRWPEENDANTQVRVALSSPFRVRP